jgi:cytoskeleton protein RodZ
MSESGNGSMPSEDLREEPVRESAGARLTAERRSLGLSLGDIARQLKLSVRQVEALERDDYAVFAGPVFVRGFLRNYAKLLSLNPDELVAAATPSPVVLTAPVREIEDERRTSSNPERSRRIFTGIVIAALIVVAVVLLASNASRDRRADVPGSDTPALPAPPAGGSVAQSEPPATSPSAEPPSALAKPADSAAGQTPAPSNVQAGNVQAGNMQAGIGEPAASASEPAPGAPSSPVPGATEPGAKARILISGNGSAQVRMVFEGESWVEVRDATGTTIFSRLNAPGTERLIRGNPPLSLVVGNASSVKLMFREKTIDLQPHTKVDVARITLE